MTDDLRTHVERVILSHRMELADAFDNHWTCKCGATPMLYAAHLADAVIRELPELRRISQAREVCVAMLNADRVPGEPLSDRAWLADTVLNVLNGEVDA